MKLNLRDKSKLVTIGSLMPGECFKYWPNPKTCPETYCVCIKTDGRFCLTDCRDFYPSRYVVLTTGEENGSKNGTLVEPLDLTAGD